MTYTYELGGNGHVLPPRLHVFTVGIFMYICIYVPK